MTKSIVKAIKPKTTISTRNSTNKLRIQLHTGNISKVQTNLQSQTEIKNILKKYQHTQELNTNQQEALYGDFSTSTSYHEAQNILLDAQDQFDALDAPTRKKFNNNPAEFLEFATDNKNEDEMVKMGLATAKPIIEQPSEAIETPAVAETKE